MSEMVFFTNNYTDQSTREGYQFEFNRQRCGNGYASTPVSTKKFCGNCGTAVTPGSAFCSECGTSTA